MYLIANLVFCIYFNKLKSSFSLPLSILFHFLELTFLTITRLIFLQLYDSNNCANFWYTSGFSANRVYIYIGYYADEENKNHYKRLSLSWHLTLIRLMKWNAEVIGTGPGVPVLLGLDDLCRTYIISFINTIWMKVYWQFEKLGEREETVPYTNKYAQITYTKPSFLHTWSFSSDVSAIW